jgi:very-short-patch-repair endonuclease
MAAVLACGEGAVLSHESAAALWKLLPYLTQPAPIHITVPESDRGRRAGIRVHRIRALPDDETTRLKRIPITTAARTILDLAATVSTFELEQLVARAERANLTTHSKLLSLHARYPKRPGTRALRTLLKRNEPPSLSHPGTEQHLLALIRRARLPLPETNVRVLATETWPGYEVDFLWREHKLVVETDGWATHGDRRSFAADRARDAELAAAGYVVIRFTWRHVTEEPEATVARVAAALASRHAR